MKYSAFEQFWVDECTRQGKHASDILLSGISEAEILVGLNEHSRQIDPKRNLITSINGGVWNGARVTVRHDITIPLVIIGNFRAKGIEVQP